MSQHDFVIANQTANSARLDINAGLQALASNNSGDSAPSTTYANMWWYETDSNLLKIRNENDSAWINVAYVDQSNSVYAVLDDTKLVNTSGAQTGLLGGQLQSAWNAGTGTTESLVSPVQVKSAITTNLPTPKAVAEAYVTYSGSTPTQADGYGFSNVSSPSTGITSFVFSTAQTDTNYIIDSHFQGGIGYGDMRYSWWVYAKSTTGFSVRYRFVTLVDGNLDIWAMARRLT